MTPDDIALHSPGTPAAILTSTGVVLDFAALSQRACRLACAMAAGGLRQREHIAVLLENRLEYFEVLWAAQRLGLYYAPVNWHLQPDEVAHILGDSGARWVFVSASLQHLIRRDDLPALERVIVLDDVGSTGYEALLAAHGPLRANIEELEGQAMFYSSGTTGRPKGIKRELPLTAYGTTPPWETMLVQTFGLDAHTVYLCPAPLYHAAPLGWTMAVQRQGGTVILMERFDPREALRLIEKYRVTHVQMVPTHFVQLLKLPEAERTATNVSSLRMAVHAAAPCPVEVKAQMLAWWGPIIHEFYSFSEGTGMTYIGPQDWLAHKGSVGRPLLGTFRILDQEGNDLPPGETGVIWVEGGGDFVYHNDRTSTAAAHDPQGRTSVGDMGYLDHEGYLYLTDRVSHMIISGGVNIYPQEVENLLVMHPAVADVAVIGVPDPHYGERVLAVVVAAPGVDASETLAAELIEYCRARIAHFKCPRELCFAATLPRLPTGKLLKRQLRAQYAVKAPTLPA